MSRHIAILTLLVAICNITAGQEVNLRSGFDTTAILTGDQVWFRITLEKPEGINLFIQKFSDSISGKIEILRGPVTDTLRSQGRMTITEKYLVTIFDSGRYEVPPVFAESVSESGIKRFYSDYSYIKVSRPGIAPPDSTMKFFDIIGPYKAPLTPGEVLPWLLLITVFCGIAYYIFRYFRGLRKVPGNAGEELPSEAPHIIAYRNLERLKSEKLWKKRQYKEYYTRLADIVRTYIDTRFGLNSLESTTGEIIQDFERVSPGSGEATDALKQLLMLADMVKFAKYVPDDSDCELSMEQAWSFVSLTRKDTPSADAAAEERGEGGEGL